MTKRILVLGINGMLGHTCFEYFTSLKRFKLFGTWRREAFENIGMFDATEADISELINEIRPDWIINCIGVIKQKIQFDIEESIENAFTINSNFPKKLASAIAGTDVKVLQIATDCVFKGEAGSYSESSLHDATDAYGQSKSLGEIQAPEFMNLRVSIIGRERDSNYSLTDWFLTRSQGATVDGYINHFWNGITTLAFARIAEGIIQKGEFSAGTFHIVPNDEVSKFELLKMMRQHFKREDLTVIPAAGPENVDRRLSTIHPDLNAKLWSAAGYRKVPTISELLKELTTFN
jgi:dTDP-4-dehydrorhamnose reductase